MGEDKESVRTSVLPTSGGNRSSMRKGASFIVNTFKASAREQNNYLGLATLLMIFAMFVISGSTLAVIYTRDTHIQGDGVLEDNNGNVVSTKNYALVFDVVMLPYLGGAFDYTRVKSLTLPVDGKTLSLHVVGASWLNTTEMDLFLGSLGSAGLTLHISGGEVLLGPGSDYAALSASLFDDGPVALGSSRRRQLAAARRLGTFTTILASAAVEGGAMLTDYVTGSDLCESETLCPNVGSQLAKDRAAAKAKFCEENPSNPHCPQDEDSVGDGSVEGKGGGKGDGKGGGSR